MIIVKHRINTRTILATTPHNQGVEIDIRTIGNRLILQHDPFTAGEALEQWLQEYKHKLLILNVKEEGLEHQIIEMMNQYNISNYFFLDQSVPFLIRTAKLGEKRCAVRVSEYESIETALSLQGLVDWVWIDSFNTPYITSDMVHTLKKANYKICLVSPELHSLNRGSEIITVKQRIKNFKHMIDAVCTKYPQRWL
ncbi:phosphatidylinositol-specific phospholipase C/glycerophosphodiester phosphodiesterase family protein [Shewanella woodyi]|uniref:Uncharacterized protein n=1 Tax=Shewanella woodyi (strain ATCC 51908 / MS32) TaxID=392500 RepID=B1KQN9_SHEWM|nr:phosphatidylinositol-specific phospholipase C/glycerophosphodiester phosphodiesterase family protein [Shewanella woodyi]ACA86278.1 conserved hypothetical protein [Shewanella woodyi ATCC 51908]